MVAMATTWQKWVLCTSYILILILVPSSMCHTFDEFEPMVEIGEPVYNPYAMVHRTVRQVDTSEGNITVVVEDDHTYYKVLYHQDAAAATDYWVDLSRLSAKKHPNLSTNPRLAAKIALDFPFPFYGHNITDLFLTTGGFMYLGSYIHRFLAATQYIAPLMANFDPASSPNCSINYYANASHFIAEWTDVLLGDNLSAGSFSFQTTLRDSGEIIFAYKKVPIPVSTISEKSHPIKVGVADAFYMDKKLSFWIKKRTIYEYHKVMLDSTRVTGPSAIVLVPLPTCNLHSGCQSCTLSQSSFNCTWCQSARRCSDGFDRHRQLWISSGCEAPGNAAEVPYDCPFPSMPVTTTEKPVLTMGKHPSIYTDCSEGISCYNGGICRYGECLCPKMYRGRRCEKYVNEGNKKKGNSVARTEKEGASDSGDVALRIGTIVGSIFIAILVLALVGWVIYAYRNPNTNSGMFLIDITRFRFKKKEENGIGYHYHKPDDNDEVDIII